MARAGELGVDQALTFLKEVDAINMRRRGHVVDRARAACGGSFLGIRVGVLGAAFKPNSDDVRDSPALNVAGQIQLQGAQVTVYDPRGIDNAKALFPTLGYADSALEACQRRRPRAAPHRVAGVPRHGPGRARRRGGAAADHRRPQRPRPGAVAGGRLDVRLARPAVTEQDTIREVLALQTWAVVGLRQNPARPAYGVAQFLQRQGKRVVPVHRQPQDVFGEPAYARLADIPHPVDVVDVFVNSTWPVTSPTRPSPWAPRPCGSSSGSSTRRPPNGSAPPGC